jgi:hypothetical protein
MSDNSEPCRGGTIFKFLSFLNLESEPSHAREVLLSELLAPVVCVFCPTKSQVANVSGRFGVGACAASENSIF